MTERVSTARVSRVEPLSVLWCALAAPQSLFVLVGLVTLVLALGTLIPQIPPQAMENPQAWLAVQTGFLGPKNGLVRGLGLFDVYHTLWFHLLLVPTGLALFVRAVESAELAWHATARSAWSGATAVLRGREAEVSVSPSLSPDEIQARLRVCLPRSAYRLNAIPGQPVPSWLASRRELSLWTRPVIYGALLTMLVGLAVVSNWGWQNEDWQPIRGENQPIGHGTPYQVRLDNFGLLFDKDGKLYDYRSQIVWLENDRTIEQVDVSVGQPATVRGVSVRQVGYVPAINMRGWDEAGQPLAFQAAPAAAGPANEVEVRFSSPEDQPFVFVPEHDLFLSLAFEPLSSSGKPALFIDLLQDGGTDRQALGSLSESAVFAVNDLRVEVELTYHPIMRVDYRPATGLVIGSLLLAVVCITAVWLFPPQLAWITIDSSNQNTPLVRLTALFTVREGIWFSCLTDQLREALAHDA
jgi:hypothetical protein